MILKGTTPMKTETEYTYTINGNLLTKKESGGALSWKYTHDENDNVPFNNVSCGHEIFLSVPEQSRLYR